MEVVASLYEEPKHDVAAVEWPALELIDVFKLFRSGPVETVALRGLDVRIERGEIVAVLGRSGSGKSTFLHLAAGLDTASAGEVRAFGQPLGQLDERELASYRARTVRLDDRHRHTRSLRRRSGRPDRADHRRSRGLRAGRI